MNSQSTTISKGFIIAGVMNLSVLIFSRFFTNDTIPEFDREVMSNFGLVMIVLWGLAYISIAKIYQKLKWLVAIFAIEKLAYGIIWILWIFNNNLSDVYDKDIMAGVFYAIYGINDWLFFLFFMFVFITLSKHNK